MTATSIKEEILIHISATGEEGIEREDLWKTLAKSRLTAQLPYLFRKAIEELARELKIIETYNKLYSATFFPFKEALTCIDSIQADALAFLEDQPSASMTALAEYLLAKHPDRIRPDVAVYVASDSIRDLFDFGLLVRGRNSSAKYISVRLLLGRKPNQKLETVKAQVGKVVKLEITLSSGQKMTFTDPEGMSLRYEVARAQET